MFKKTKIFEPEINFWLSKNKFRFKTFNEIVLDDTTRKNLAEFGFCYSGKIFAKVHCYACLRVVDDIFIKPSKLLHNSWCSYYYNPAPCRKIKSYYDFYYERERLSTFINWPLVSISPHDLAKNGFYFLKSFDHCMCFICNIVLGNWEIKDDIFLQHRKYNSKCYMILNNNQIFGNVTIKQSNILDKIILDCEEWPLTREAWPLTQYHTILEKRKLNVLNERNNSNIQNMYPLTEKKYINLETRVSSFTKKWPYKYSLTLSAEKMGEAGFFYMQCSDIVKCFSCGGCLNNWQLDDSVWEEHARWYPYCSFVYLIKGKTFIDRTHATNPPQLKFLGSGKVKIANTSSLNYNIDKLTNRDILEFMKEIKQQCFSPHIFGYFLKCRLETHGRFYENYKDYLIDLNLEKQKFPFYIEQRIL